MAQPRTRRNWYRTTTLFVGLTLVLLSATFSASALDRSTAPTAAQIETLLRTALTGDQPYLPSMYRRAVLQEFELRMLDGVLAPRWLAEVELLFDFGPPAPAIIGFQQHRRAIYRLIIKQQGDRLQLLRFTPVGTIHL